MSRVLIVENEPAPAALMVAQLTENFPEMEILKVCETVKVSLNAIRTQSPDLVFMDVELNNNETGFDILRKLDNINFEIIFTTAFNKYAKQACQASALYFLEKPISTEELITAVEKFRIRKSQTIDPKQIELLLSVYQRSTLLLKTFAVPTMTGLTFVETDHILYLEGASSQTILYLLGGKKQYVTRTLKECEELLSHSNFHRIHKSYLINLNHIKKYIKGRDGAVIMGDSNIELPVSRDYGDNFLSRIGRG